ncbi:MAG: 2-C-methyl-D-erythritol 2,4-cyclodiphosphate synthase [Candidatus Cloacimonetes bacterium]|nr:2-C-methyl-D-erythritol 2,4-cyclodiphosphate synthase [Candidatus Cloacimonadota bacterium]
MRIGFGYDVHRLVGGRKLILGGVEIPFEMGLAGHSDADVLLHAICDALLGALALGDIGRHFPDNDTSFKDIDSRILLRKCYELVRERGWRLGNMDATLCAQKPKLSPYIDKMREVIAGDLACEIEDISIKATTEEGLGISGGGEGMSAMVVVLLKKRD